MIEDQKIALLRAKEAGVGVIINVGTSIDASKESIAIAEGTDLVDVYATCGIHAQEGPKDIKKYGENYIEELKKVAKSSKKVVGIGECGMDFFLEATDKGPKTGAEGKEDQKELFEEQVKLAVDLDLPLIIHCRNAWEETFEIITKYSSSESKTSREVRRKFSTSSNNKIRGLFHSWTGTVAQAKKALDLGFYISFSGIVTFKNAGAIPEVAKMVPDDKILVETDSPFLSPVPLRGKQNEPKNVRITAQFLAQLRDVSLDKLSEITTDNAKKLFGLK